MYYIFYSIKLSSAVMRDNSQWSKKGKSIKFTFKVRQQEIKYIRNKKHDPRIIMLRIDIKRR